MLGMAKYIFIYEIENGQNFRLIEKRTNPYEVTMQHLKTLDVYEFINDCSIIISARIGKKGTQRLQERGMKLYFKKGNIQEALNDVKKEEKFIINQQIGCLTYNGDFEMIKVQQRNYRKFLAIIKEGNTSSKHEVILDDEYYQYLTYGKITKEELINPVR